MANGRASNKVHSFYLGYPCSVDAGVDPVSYTKMIIARINSKQASGEGEAAQILREDLCKLIPGCDTSSNDEQLIANAKELRESWDHAVHEDKTMMKDDMDNVAKFSKGMSFTEHGVNKDLKVMVITEFLDEHITHVKEFLSLNDTDRFLYLCGHGLSKDVARELRDNPADNKTKKSIVWPWKLCSCEDRMNRLPSKITGNARKGDIVVFSSGLLTPEWVVEKLRECERQQGSVQNTIVIVIDACYSGKWKTRIESCLTNNGPLQHTRVILQTSCGKDEVSYGSCFTPVFCVLQDRGTRTELQRLYEKDKGAMEGIELFNDQTPTFYDSTATNTSCSRLPNSFYLIHDVKFFKFCRKYLARQHWEASRGIDSKEYKDFFTSFSPSSSTKPKPTILCFKLKHMRKNGSPLAFFLIEWESKKYHIHLHFNGFRPGDMQLTGISHVDVTDSTSDSKWQCQYTEDPKDNKKYINSKDDHDAWHKHVQPNKASLVGYFKKFADNHVKWDDENSWYMSKALPTDLIRSRSACFQEAREKCKPMAELKPLLPRQ